MKYAYSNAMVAVALALVITACSKESAPEPVESAAEAPEPVALQRSPAADGARVYLIHPEDGATVSNPVRVEFGVEGMAIAKAGDNQPNSGHHHLLIDTAMPTPPFRFRRTHAICILAMAAPPPNSRWNPASTHCSCCWETTCTYRMTLLCYRIPSRSR